MVLENIQILRNWNGKKTDSVSMLRVHLLNVYCDIFYFWLTCQSQKYSSLLLFKVFNLHLKFVGNHPYSYTLSHKRNRLSSLLDNVLCIHGNSAK